MISQCISGANPNRNGKKMKPMTATHVPAASAIMPNIKAQVANPQPNQRMKPIIWTARPTSVLAFRIGGFVIFCLS